MFKYFRPQTVGRPVSILLESGALNIYFILSIFKCVYIYKKIIIIFDYRNCIFTILNNKKQP